MKEKTKIWTFIMATFVSGLIISYLNGDFDLSEIINDQENFDLDLLLDELILILGFIVLAILVVFVLFRSFWWKQKTQDEIREQGWEE